MIRALIVDDEPLARSAVRSMLRRHPDVEIAGECGSGADAVAAIKKCKPDLVFVDVQMPEMDAFDLLQAIAPDRVPAVIFVTAYDQYAVRAFEVHALDYLLKPFDRDRFDAALAHARVGLHADWNGKIRALLEDRTDRFIIRDGGRVFFVPAADVDWIEAQGNYVLLHSSVRSHLLRDSITHVETKLDPKRFCRIHRSSIVNVDAIRELRPGFHGDFEVVLRNGANLRLSHRYRRNLERKGLGRSDCQSAPKRC